MSYIKFQPTIAVAVTPSNTTVLSPSGTSQQGGAILYIGGTGNLVVTTDAGNVVRFLNVPKGFFPVSVSKVMANEPATPANTTTCTEIIALW